MFLKDVFEIDNNKSINIQIRPDILSGLIWLQTVFKGYQQANSYFIGSYRVLTFCRLDLALDIKSDIINFAIGIIISQAGLCVCIIN